MDSSSDACAIRGERTLNHALDHGRVASLQWQLAVQSVQPEGRSSPIVQIALTWWHLQLRPLMA